MTFLLRPDLAASIAKRDARTPRKSEEDALQIATADLCRMVLHPSVIAHHSANERHGAAAGGKAKAMGQLSGFPDWMLMWTVEFSSRPLRVGFIELKSATGRMSSEQKDFRERIDTIGGNAVGAEWALCRSLDEFTATLKAWRVPMKAGVRAR